jgi:hypothetical protein
MASERYIAIVEACLDPPDEDPGLEPLHSVGVYRGLKRVRKK